MTNRTPPPLPPPPPPSAYDASEDDDIEFHSDESDGNDGVEDEARFHSYDEPQLASKALFFQSWWTPINVRMDDPFQWKMFTIRASIDDDQWLDCHVLPQKKLSPIRLLYLVSLCFYFRKVPRNITGD